MTACIAIGLLATPASGAASSSNSPAPVAVAPVHHVKRCPDARVGLRFYRSAYNQHREDRGAETSWPVGRKPLGCADARQLAKVWRTKAATARVALERWKKEIADQWNWQAWLPDKFARVGACETGYGKRPGDWTWDSGTYVSAFGIYRPAYEAYHRWTGHNTPREQYEVAAAIQAKFGWGAWGCGGA